MSPTTPSKSRRGLRGDVKETGKSLSAWPGEPEVFPELIRLIDAIAGAVSAEQIATWGFEATYAIKTAVWFSGTWIIAGARLGMGSPGGQTGVRRESRSEFLSRQNRAHRRRLFGRRRLRPVFAADRAPSCPNTFPAIRRSSSTTCRGPAALSPPITCSMPRPKTAR